MIRMLIKPKNDIYLAISGGVDSIAAYNFLKHGGRNVRGIFVHHGTKTSEEAYQFLSDNNYLFATKRIKNTKPKDQSWEEFWRNERLAFFTFFNAQVVTAHHLDDAMETWLFGAIHGRPKLIQPRYDNIIRPFLITPKQKLVEYCLWHGFHWIEDETNNSLQYMRNKIRHEIMPRVLKINPGLSKVIIKKYLKEIQNEG